MDNLGDSETTAKISDSAYSNSCSNSQSRRSHSSKSTHSGSNSSGSSGYGGKPTSGSSNAVGQQPKKEKDAKKKKSPLIESVVTDTIVETEAKLPEPAPAFDAPKEETCDVAPVPTTMHPLSDKDVENMDIAIPDSNSLKDEVIAVSNFPAGNSAGNYTIGRSTIPCFSDGFSCVISMHDGVVMYTTSSLTTTLGFPKDMWIGRSFIDFVHPRDRSTFAAQITNGLAVPKNANATQIKESPVEAVSNMICRIRRYRELTTGFGIKERNVSYTAFLLKLTFKNISDEDGKVTCLVIQATPFFSAFKTPHELVSKSVPFTLRHASNGNIEYVDPESVPYLGYIPQDLTEKNVLQMYHPDDLHYLCQVYEGIVKEGGLPRSKAYRMLTQNGDYVKLETEWSSFINPWSKKLEFVIGKHHLVEGPANPNVFQLPDADKTVKISEEEKSKVIRLKESILRIMNEVPTKPAEAAKQQMSKRCQDLALFMESLMEDTPKIEDDLRLEIQEPDNSYYERDSVMLGGISPHHEYNDSKSSTETPLSYNQLNYNETLQRYFESHQPYSYEDYNTVTGENIFGLKDNTKVVSSCLSPMAQHSGDSGNITSSSESNAMIIDSPTEKLRISPAIHLTEHLLSKHNSEMEKELLKIHRETRSSTKGGREKTTNDTRQKKKEHLARCNASYQPTTAGAATSENQPHGVKRASKCTDSENAANKHHCPSQQHPSRHHRQLIDYTTSEAVNQPCAIATTASPPCWPGSTTNHMNAFVMGVGVPQQMSFLSPVPAMPGMFPLYYASPGPVPFGSTIDTSGIPSSSSATMRHPQPLPCMIYASPVYGPSFVYSPINSHLPYPYQQTMLTQSSQCTNSMNYIGLANRNYEEVSGIHNSQRRNQRSAMYSSDMKSSSSFSPKSTEAVLETLQAGGIQNSKMNRFANSDETVDKTDGESSYSSFYSSFFRTESGSAEESSDAKKTSNENSSQRLSGRSTIREPKFVKRVARRKMDPPWMEKVCVTSELIYKYQILTKDVEEALLHDKQKLNSFEQPSLVNDQLGQLYLDMQLEGVAARLTLEEGITSSSSSGEETSSKQSKGPRRKREYSRMTMIYEEDAPLPPGEPEVEPVASGSSAF